MAQTQQIIDSKFQISCHCSIHNKSNDKIIKLFATLFMDEYILCLVRSFLVWWRHLAVTGTDAGGCERLTSEMKMIRNCDTRNDNTS